MARWRWDRGVAVGRRLSPERRCLSSIQCSVSTSRSSNRTCGFPASGSRTRLHAFTREFGDIGEGFYDSLCTTLHEIKKLLTSEEGRPLYGQVQARLAALAKRADGIGWGYGDYVVDVVGEIAADNEDEG